MHGVYGKQCKQEDSKEYACGGGIGIKRGSQECSKQDRRSLVKTGVSFHVDYGVKSRRAGVQDRARISKYNRAGQTSGGAYMGNRVNRKILINKSDNTEQNIKKYRGRKIGCAREGNVEGQYREIGAPTKITGLVKGNGAHSQIGLRNMVIRAVARRRCGRYTVNLMGGRGKTEALLIANISVQSHRTDSRRDRWIVQAGTAFGKAANGVCRQKCDTEIGHTSVQGTPGIVFIRLYIASTGRYPRSGGYRIC